jgi:hypothetical protein
MHWTSWQCMGQGRQILVDDVGDVDRVHIDMLHIRQYL